MKYLAITLLLLLTAISLSAQPPKPQEGKRWMLNEQFSDEFNGEELDLSKWYDYHPYWQGRPPAKFTPSMVSVKDGLLCLKNQKMEGAQPGDTWQIMGAAVVSRTRGAHFGYYECSQLASKIRMSSTFWMSNGTAAGPDPCSGDRYSQELDIQEAVGGHSEGSSFRTHMHSNTHYWYTDCNGNKQTYSKGSQIPLESGEVSDTFHVYAAHWKNSTTVSFYLDGKHGNTVLVRQDVDPTPFERPMQINMVTETYDWVTPPTDEDLADDSRNTTYIDYVRSWKLVDVDYRESGEDDLLENGGFETGDLSGWIGWGVPREVVSNEVHSGNYAVHVKGAGAPEQELNLRAYATYTLSCYGKVASGSGAIILGIKDGSENILGSAQVTETSWTRKEFSFTTGSSGAGLKMYYYAQNTGVEGWGDNFELVLEEGEPEEPAEIPIFDENLRFDEWPAALPTNDPINIPVLYQANGDRVIHLQLRNEDSVLVSEKVFPAYAGYGLKRLEMPVDPQPEAGEYMLIANIRHADSTEADPQKTDLHYLVLQNPVELSIKVRDLRDNAPLEGVKVQIREDELITNAEGMAVFPEVSAGSYELSLEKEGYENLLLEGLEAIEDTLLELVLRPLSYRVEILVTDAIEGKVIEGALVELGDSSMVSKLDGRAVFLSYTGDYSLLVSADRYHDHSSSLSVVADESYHAQLIRSLANVKFVVKQDDQYLKDALVSIGNESGNTSGLGIVNFKDLQTATPHDYSISHEGSILLEDRLELRSDSTVRINLYTSSTGPAGDISLIRLYPNPAGDRLYTSGLEYGSGCTIYSISGQALRKESLDENGSLDLAGLPAGFYLLAIEGQKPLPFSKE